MMKMENHMSKHIRSISKLFCITISLIITGMSCYGQLLPGHAYKSVGQYHWLLNHATITDPDLALRLEDNSKIRKFVQRGESDLVECPPDYMYIRRQGDTFTISFDEVFRKNADDKIEPIGFTRIGKYLVVFDKSMYDYIRLDSSSFAEFKCLSNPDIILKGVDSEHYLFKKQTEQPYSVSGNRNATYRRPEFVVPDTVKGDFIWHFKPVRFKSDFAQRTFENFVSSPECGVYDKFYSEGYYGYLRYSRSGKDYVLFIYDEVAIKYENINPVGYMEINGHIILFDRAVTDDLNVVYGDEMILKTYDENLLSELEYWMLFGCGYGDSFSSFSWGVIEPGLGAGSHYFNWPPLGLE